MLNHFLRSIFTREQSFLPASVKAVETSIPAFIGYTEGGAPEPTRIKSIHQYRSVFGGPAHELPRFTIDASGSVSTETDILPSPVYKMYYSLQLYFANGGGACYVISAGNFNDNSPSVSRQSFLDSLELLEQEEEPTLIVFPDAPSLSDITHYHDLYKAALLHCSRVDNRFLICDVKPALNSSTDPTGEAVSAFRNGMGINNLMHGAAYYPNLETSLGYQFEEDAIQVDNNGTSMVLRHTDAALNEDPSKKEQSLYHADEGAFLLHYQQILNRIKAVDLVLPPSGALAGTYFTVDHARGVWKAPANVSLNYVLRPAISITNDEQQNLAVHTSGKSINAIREFPGHGVLVWGARTLTGNDNEWRYVSVRRFANMIEASLKKATDPFVFEPNDANTWRKIKTMTENFLTLQWREGALAGSKPKDAFFVKVGLGETMTHTDIQNGIMIIQIGIAVVRPAEFIILKITREMKQA